MPLVTRLLLDLSAWTLTYWFLAIPLWIGVGAVTCVPFRRSEVENRVVVAVYLVASFFVSLSIPTIFLPIFEMQKALRQD